MRVDQSELEEAWKVSADPFRKVTSLEAWMEAMNRERVPLGEAKARKLVNAEFTDSIQGVGSGRFFVMDFDSSFSKKEAAKETLIMKQENDGEWREAAYNIR